MIESNRIQNIVVVGHGFEPAFASLLLQSRLEGLGIELTYLDLGCPEADELLCSLAALRQIHSDLKIAEADFVRRTRAEINLGFDYLGFNQNQAALFCDAAYGFNLDGKRFYYLLQRLQEQESVLNANFEDYCLTAKMARIGHFTPPSNDEKSLYSSIQYGYRINPKQYQMYLRELAIQRGVHYLKIDELSATVDDQGAINSIATADGEIEVDLLLDMSRGRAIKSRVSERLDPLYGEQGAIECKCTQVPAEQAKPYASIQKADDALCVVGDYQGMEYRTELRPTNSMSLGQCYYDPEPWKNNCIAMGLSFSDRKDLLIDRSYILFTQLIKLLDNWPWLETLPTAAKSYNRAVLAQFDQVLAMDRLHLAEAFDRAELLTESIRYKRMVYQQRGKVVYYENEVLQEQQWPVLFACLGIRPQALDISVLTCDARWLENELEKIKSVMAKAAAAAPKYSDFIKKVHS